MRGLRMCWNLVTQLLILISLTLSNSSEARNVKHIHPYAVVVGTVYCDTCFQDDFSRSSHFISGATVSVECKNAAFKKEVKTNKKGEFEVHLPFSVSKHEKEIKGCQVRLVKSSEPHCAAASTRTSSSIQLKSQKQGTHVFSAGFFTFKPVKQPDHCNQQQSITSATTKIDSKKSLTDPITNTPLPDPVQLLPPLPQLPALPPLPDLPIQPPKQTKELESSKEAMTRPQSLFPPVFASPPPAISLPLPPNPLEPPPLLPLPPTPLQPPSPPAFGLPNIPGLPTLPPPALPVPVPPMLPIPPLPSLPPLPPIIPSLPPAKKRSP